MQREQIEQREIASEGFNLPLQLSRFIGREQAIDDIKRTVWTTRLLTLTGPGGYGKTRLALEAARRMPENPDEMARVLGIAGSWFWIGTALSGLACIVLGYCLFAITLPPEVLDISRPVEGVRRSTAERSPVRR